MPYDAHLAERLVNVITNRFNHIAGLTENKMFGGFGYMLNGNMCVGIHKETLIIRVGVENAEKLTKEPHVRPMDFTGKVMKGWATVEPEAIKNNKALTRYCKYAVEFVSQLPGK